MAGQNSSVDRRQTRYSSGGVTEVSDGRLEWWERTVFDSDANDQLYTVDQITAGRLDVIAKMFLGESRLWWVLAQYNKILDPFGEVVAGAQLFIPSPERVDAMLSGRAGGVPSTRVAPTTILPIV